MALRAIDLGAPDAPAPTSRHAAATAPVGVLRTPLLAPPRTATITVLRPKSRGEALAEARRERRRWLAIGAVVFFTPFAACLGVLGVVR